MTQPREPGAAIGTPVPPPAEPDDEGVDMGGLDLSAPANKRLTPEERKVAHQARMAQAQAERADRRERSRIGAQARERFFAARKQARNIATEPVVLTAAGDVDTDKSGEAEDWSFRAYAREVFSESLGFDYSKRKAADAVPVAEGEAAAAEPAPVEVKAASGRTPERRRGDHRPRPNISEVQTNEDHAQARAALTELFGARFTADRQRVIEVHNSAVSAISALANGDQDIFNMVVQDGKYEGPVGKRLEHFYDALETERYERVMDAVDWFAVRCAQAEETMKQVTARVDLTDVLAARLRKLKEDPNYLAMLTELDADVVMIESFKTMEIGGTTGLQTKAKSIIGRQIARAKRLRQKLTETQTDMEKIAENNAEGKDKIEAEKQKIREVLLQSADSFIRIAQEKTRGMSPLQERDFWESIVDRIMDAAPPQRGETPLDRFKRMNGELHIFHQPGGPGTKVVLLRAPGEQAVGGDFENITNADQLLAVAEEEAKSLGVLRKSLSFTKAVLGPGTERRRSTPALRKLLAGHPNSDKIEMVRLLNEKLGEMQKRAVSELDSADADFKDKRAGREPKEFTRARKGPDLELKNKLRAKMYELLGIGAPDDPDYRPLRDYTALPEDEEVVATRAEADANAVALERQERGADTYYEVLKSDGVAGLITRMQAEFGNDAPTKEGIYKNFFKDIATRGLALLTGLPDKDKGTFVTAMKKALELAKPGPEKTGRDLLVEEIGYVRALRQFFIRCEQLKALLGDGWVEATGLILNTGAEALIDTAKMEGAVAVLHGEVFDNDFVDAFGLTEGNNQAVLLGKVGAALKTRLSGVGAEPKQIAELVLLSSPGEPHKVQSFDPDKRIDEVVKLLEADAEGSWRERLVKHDLAKIEGEVIVYNVRAIRKVMNQAKDSVVYFPRPASAK